MNRYDNKSANSGTNDLTMLSPGDLVTEDEAAQILCISVQTLRNWRWLGVGPRFRKVGLRMVRYYRGDLADFVTGRVAEEIAA